MTDDRVGILVVDDHPENIVALRATLRDLGAEIIGAASGNEALRLMLARKFSVVLLDVQMPDMDGFETAELMRSHDHLKHTPIIFVTAIGKEDSQVFQGYASGAVDYILKPVNPDILRSKVRAFLELHQAELNRSRLELEKNAARNLESLRILAGGIAHDFNNLLTVILANISVVQKASALSPDDRSALGDAVAASQKAHALSRELLTLFPGGQPRLMPTEMFALVKEAVARFSQEPSISTVLEVPRLPPVPVNREQMLRVFESLALNAQEAMPQGGRITIRADLVSPPAHAPASLAPGEYVRVAVSDSGVGIHPADLPRVFEPYFTTKRMGARKGTGLGLSICQSIVQKHRGAITVQSEVSRGTTVSVYLPVSPAKPSS